ncbi:hypothetical protein MBLNU459_g2845t1 [Dothideomycetes sp. NU459]
MSITTAGHMKQALPINQTRFESILRTIWSSGPRRSGDIRPRLGLAISGGVDSMALASLCSNTRASGDLAPSFTAFVVDHRLRKDSHEEAHEVAKTLESLKINTRVLRLDWDVEYPERLVNLESAARKKRFQALGRACRDMSIASLLLAHHGDDQAETVLSRLVNGYVGSGLRGIKSEGDIPECHGVYGVSQSGRPHVLRSNHLETASAPMPIEGGGVQIYRPLLEFRKSELIATCQQNSVRWFEDPTNEDKTLTIRNAVRALLRTDRLPTSLSTAALRQTAVRVEGLVEAREQAAETIFNACKIELDMCSSSLTVQYPSNIRELLLHDSPGATREAKYVAAILIRRLLSLVSPKPTIELQSLDLAVQYSFPFLLGDETEERMLDMTSVNVASVIITRLEPAETGAEGADPQYKTPLPQSDFITTTFDCRIQMLNPDKNLTLIPACRVRDRTVIPTWTDWQLANGCFWIRIRYRPFNHTPGCTVSLRLLRQKDIVDVRERDPKAAILLQKLLRQTAPGKRRFNLPVIVESIEITAESGAAELREKVCALPTIGWAMPGWRAGSDEQDMSSPWGYECRYKAIDFGKGKAHSIKRIYRHPRRVKGRSSRRKSVEAIDQTEQSVWTLER